MKAPFVVLAIVGSLLTLHAAADPPASLPRIEAGEDHLVSGDQDNFPLLEPYLAVDPNDAKHLLAAAMVIKKADFSSMDCAVLLSIDGGKSWSRHDLGLQDAADVWAAFAGDGTALVSSLEGATPVIARSVDGGKTWPDKPVSLAGSHDHPTMVIDRSAGKLGRLYVVSGASRRNKDGKGRSALAITASNDAGATFEEPVYVIASNLSYEAANPVVASDGTLFVPFSDHHRPGSRRRLERPREWLTVSRDRGKTFSEPLLVAESCEGPGGWASMAAGSPGTPLAGRIYHLCIGTGFEGVRLRYSDDGGERWSDPSRADHPGDAPPYARTPALAVNKDGVVGVAWYDARNDRQTVKGNFRCQEIYFSVSLDGGQTFLPEVKLSSAKLCPLGPTSVDVALRFPAGGEYMGMVALPDGSFDVLWADSSSGTYQLRMANARLAKP